MTSWRVIEGNCIEVMASMPEASVDAVVCDPPYGLEFMGKEWDRLDGDAWRTGGGFSKPGIGDRPTAWASFGSGDTANATCATCGGRMRGARRCECEEPDWRVKGMPLGEATADTRQGQARKMQDWHECWVREALRVLKPGGHLLAFGGTRTYHRLTCAIEDAGFEIRDCLTWLYGSGFPKSLDVGKAIDKAAGAEREVVAQGEAVKRMIPGADQNATGAWIKDNGREFVPTETRPATPEAAQWDGWGTALKPAHEPIVLARKPLSGTVAGNVLEHGTGALNVDGCRIESGDGVVTFDRHAGDRDRAQYRTGTAVPGTRREEQTGRWPANVVLDEQAAVMLDEQSGTLQSGEHKLNHVRTAPRLGHGGTYGDHAPPTAFTVERPADSGGASRFFYTAKASRSERGEGNVHPTVKPVSLMRWLVRLVTPPEGSVLDPFTGSGSTGIAALREGFSFVGIEREPEYVEIARERIRQDQPLFNVGSEAA